MKVLVVGSGGREHTLAWKIAQSALVQEVICVPGNPGTAGEPKVRNIAATIDDIDSVVQIAKQEGIGLAVIGPEAPLVAGMADALRAAGIDTVGPNADGARLEGSKAFAKEVMVAAGIPTAAYREVRTVEDVHAACDFFAEEGVVEALVVKADGLAAGKGVVVCEGIEDARQEAIRFLTDRPFGDSSDVIVLEERLDGVEASYIVLAQGENYLSFPVAQDHKRLLDGDEGPNTGGMGAYTPASFITDALDEEIRRTIVEPSLVEIKKRGMDFRGFLFVGVMLSSKGPRVLEFNTRLGDPETQVLLTSLRGDIVPALVEAAKGALQQKTFGEAGPSAVVVMASHGYPESPRRGDVIRGLDDANAVTGVRVLHAGTRQDGDDILTNGGRVLGVTALGDTVQEALDRAYEAASKIDFDGAQYRKDIGYQVR